jgi:hypothetical protein
MHIINSVLILTVFTREPICNNDKHTLHYPLSVVKSMNLSDLADKSYKFQNYTSMQNTTVTRIKTPKITNSIHQNRWPPTPRF